MALPDFLNERYRALLDISISISGHHSLAELLAHLAQELPRVITCSSITVALYDSDRNTMRLHLLETLLPSSALPEREYPIEDIPEGWVWQHQKPFVCMNVEQETRFFNVMAKVGSEGITSFSIAPLTTTRGRLGSMGVWSNEGHSFEGAELDFLQQVAKQVAVAIENALNFERAQQAEKEMRSQYERERLMLGINNAIVAHLELPELLKAVSACLRRVIPHDLAGFCLHDATTNRLLAHSLNFPSNQEFDVIGDPIPFEGTPEGLAFTSRETVLIKQLSLAEFPSEIIERGLAAGLRSGCAVPLISHGQALGTLSVVSLRENAFSEDDAALLGNIGSHLAIAVENVLAYQEIATLILLCHKIV